MPQLLIISDIWSILTMLKFHLTGVNGTFRQSLKFLNGLNEKTPVRNRCFYKM